jgi:SAM-dependent methyltransferase
MRDSEGRSSQDTPGLQRTPSPRVPASVRPDAEDAGEIALNDPKWAAWLVCPACGLRLQQDDDNLQCSECKKRWPIVNGIPDFVGDFPYWGEIPIEQMREVNRRVETEPWKTPLLDSTEPSVQRAASMILNLDRANWQWLLDLPTESRVLDIGAGMGTNSHALATHYREVIAVEPVVERIHFMQQRFAQERLSNIKILRSSVWALPFSKATFDLVVMNGVLEWVATGQPGDPGDIQESALCKVLDLLKPGGYLYLGIENRLGLGYFVGYSDPHCGLPFVTVLPRRLAHWYARKKGFTGGYRNYLYSSRGYRKLLQKAGFAAVDVYVALPSYNHPRFLIPLQNNIFSYYSHIFNPLHKGRLRGLVYEVLLHSGLLKYLEYSFVILARK